MKPILLFELGKQSGPDDDKILNALKIGLLEELNALGIDCNIQIKMNEKVQGIAINGIKCQYPDNLTDQVNSYTKLFSRNRSSIHPDSLYWKTLIEGIIWLDPTILFNVDQSAHYVSILESNSTFSFSEYQNELFKLFKEILSLRISLSDNLLIAKMLGRYVTLPDINWDIAREELISNLCHNEIIIRLNRSYFESLISSSNSKDNYFGMMRDGLFYELGIKYPDFLLEFSDKMPENVFQLKINDLTSTPITGSGNAEILVNDTVEGLDRLNIKGRRAVNPANSRICSFISKADAKRAEQNGLTTWNASGYFILQLSSELRKNSFCFINTKFTRKYLDDLGYIFPNIVDIIDQDHYLPLLTKNLRLLIREEISIRNMPYILGAFLDYDHIHVDSSKYIVFDDRLPVNFITDGSMMKSAESMVEFIRVRLKSYISHKYTMGGSTLVVYLLDPVLEKQIVLISLKKGKPDNNKINQILHAVEKELVKLPMASQPPVILTTSDVRHNLRDIIKNRLPNIAVLSYQELSPDMNIQPVARISLI